MIDYEVKGTSRDNFCDKNSAIANLILNRAYKGFTVHSVENLKELADQGRLFVYCQQTYKPIIVLIFWSHLHDRWIATTRADGVQCNNLLNLPMYGKSQEGNSYYECPVRY